MSSVLFGLALISATLQTALAMFVEGHLFGIPFALVVIYSGWCSLKNGVLDICKRRQKQQESMAVMRLLSVARLQRT